MQSCIVLMLPQYGDIKNGVAAGGAQAGVRVSELAAACDPVSDPRVPDLAGDPD